MTVIVYMFFHFPSLMQPYCACSSAGEREDADQSRQWLEFDGKAYILTQVMKGVRILEVAQFTFVPVAGAILADWGADVIKIEHPVRGDTQRGFIKDRKSTRLNSSH